MAQALLDIAEDLDSVRATKVSPKVQQKWTEAEQQHYVARWWRWDGRRSEESAEVHEDLDSNLDLSGWRELKHRLDGPLDSDTFKRGVYVYIKESVKYVQNSGAKLDIVEQMTGATQNPYK